MQCNDIREMLSAYIDGVLDEPEMLVVEDHIRICSFCSQELTALRETVKLLNSLGEVRPPEGFRSQVLLRLEAIPEEAARETGLDDGSTLTGVRQWFGGINKYLVAAVLMIGLGIGTGLYKLGVLAGPSAINLAYDSKAPLKTTESIKINENIQLQGGLKNDKQEKSEAEPPKIDPNTPADSGSVSQQAESPSNKGFVKADAPSGIMGAGSTPNLAQNGAQEPARITAADSASKSTAGEVDNLAGSQMVKIAETPAQDSGMTETKVLAVKPTVSPVIQNSSLVIEVGNFQAVAARIPEMVQQNGGFINNSTENLVQPATGYFILKVPAQNFKGLILELENLGKVTQRQTQGTVVANDLKNVDESAGYSTIELEIKSAPTSSDTVSSSPEAASTSPEGVPRSAEAKSSKVSSPITRWILPWAFLTMGMGLAGYHIYLRWRKKY